MASTTLSLHGTGNITYRVNSIAILGTGAWGKALATIALANGYRVQMWSRGSKKSLDEVLVGAEAIVSAIPMKGVTETVEKIRQVGLQPRAIVVTATKGLDPKTTRTPSTIWQDAFPDRPVVVLSGPNLSKEIEQGLPAATVVASNDTAAAEEVQKVFASEKFRVYTNDDPIGTELGGTLKNVMAIASGVCDGLNLGTNARSALLTRALAEIVRIGTHFGAQPETFFGLSGLGDMLATCSSPLSRNYRVGYGLARGKLLEEILEELQSTAEGVNTTNVLIRIADREGIPVPISRQVHRLLNGRISPQEAVEALMERDLKPEFCDIDPIGS